MEYHAIVLNNIAVFRQADHGINDTEWEMGCRYVLDTHSSRLVLFDKLFQIGHAVVSEDYWRELINNPEDITNDKFIFTTKYDKWDVQQTIY
jgi:hypothetical protein